MVVAVASGGVWAVAVASAGTALIGAQRAKRATLRADRNEEADPATGRVRLFSVAFIPSGDRRPPRGPQVRGVKGS
jgi:hypothetical protein